MAASNFVEEIDLRFPPDHPLHRNRRPKTEAEKAQDVADANAEDLTAPPEKDPVQVLTEQLNDALARIAALEARPGGQP